MERSERNTESCVLSIGYSLFSVLLKFVSICSKRVDKKKELFFWTELWLSQTQNNMRYECQNAIRKASNYWQPIQQVLKRVVNATNRAQHFFAQHSTTASLICRTIRVVCNKFVADEDITRFHSIVCTNTQNISIPTPTATQSLT